VPGLDLYAAARGGASAGSTQAAPVTAGVAAFSPNATVALNAGGNPLHPNQPFGLAFWTGVGAIALLLVVRHSLPR
jgi:hypothetical protein